MIHSPPINKPLTNSGRLAMKKKMRTVPGQQRAVEREEGALRGPKLKIQTPAQMEGAHRKYFLPLLVFALLLPALTLIWTLADSFTAEVSTLNTQPAENTSIKLASKHANFVLQTYAIAHQSTQITAKHRQLLYNFIFWGGWTTDISIRHAFKLRNSSSNENKRKASDPGQAPPAKVQRPNDEDDDVAVVADTPDDSLHEKVDSLLEAIKDLLIEVASVTGQPVQNVQRQVDLCSTTLHQIAAEKEPDDTVAEPRKQTADMQQKHNEIADAKTPITAPEQAKTDGQGDNCND
ncbi:hypothetical protein NM208_g12184 [Fusarium decemcellulare]|uniref:Uncharacterized protein n=1 Tax=Fusarium decemcellulare TaxID=57161 RepID=A0ACC1RT73_9HYPO|nr:hypothetical protein NM208_g12184 [Fusarium decemcellulare]